jgi:hypothetical protein
MPLARATSSRSLAVATGTVEITPRIAPPIRRRRTSARGRALDVLGRDAVVSDLGRGHREDLTRVREIRQRLLVTAHGGVEDDFAHTLEITEGSAEGTSVEDRPVLKGEAREFRGGRGARV